MRVSVVALLCLAACPEAPTPGEGPEVAALPAPDLEDEGEAGDTELSDERRGEGSDNCGPETCNGIDDDCDGRVDEDAIDAFEWHLDQDWDGFGHPARVVLSCSRQPGLSPDDRDCDDQDPSRNPAGIEVCDGEDDDCDGLVDEGTPEVRTVWPDADGDGHGAEGAESAACSLPEGMVEVGGDCDDADAAISPDAIEVCDGLDNDCDGDTDGRSSGFVTRFLDFQTGLDVSVVSVGGRATRSARGGDYVLRLTDAVKNQRGAAWLVEPVISERWSATFSFEIHGGGGGEGVALAFLHEHDLDAYGLGSSMLGLGGLEGFAVEVDTVSSDDHDTLGGAHVAVVDTADFSELGVVAIADPSNHGAHSLIVDYDLGLVTVAFDGSEILEVDLGAPEVDSYMLGFSAATGPSLGRAHEIDDVTIEAACP